MRGLNLFANDFDPDVNVCVYLVRKLITNGTTPKESGYRTMAETNSTGAVNSVVREFSGGRPTAAVVDNTKYEYYAEMVICGNTVEPFMVQVAYQ